ncbi:MAG: FAD-dependent oxidoreductase [Bacteroidales bacterium]|nr:FAD-dependent oxidoreductase [Bacteroidales bacterium]
MQTDILIIGGSAAGFVAASTAKLNYPNKKVVLFRNEEVVMIPCGIPYIYGTTGSSEKNVLPDMGLKNAGVEINIGEITDINCSEKFCKSSSGEQINFEKLIIATGSTPIKPQWLKGSHLQNVYVIPKNKKYLDSFQTELENIKDIAIIGAGFIGVEVADELKKIGKNVTIIEKQNQILPAAFDEEIAAEANAIISERGVKVITGSGIKEIIGNEKVQGIILEDGREIQADAVVLSMGYAPNNELAKKCGLTLNEKGFIQVDEYMRTSVHGIFAAGDCAEKRDFFTRKISSTMLASTACAEARIAAMNIFQLSVLKTFGGTIAIYSTAVGNTSFSTAGLTEKMAIDEGYNIITGVFEGVDRHPGALPGSHKQKVKLIVSKECGTILGAEIIGGISSGELINVVGIMIQSKMSLASLITSQIGTHPLLTASPAAYPLIKAAEMAWKQIKMG